jgi:type IV pilus assembly protein PilY1
VHPTTKKRFVMVGTGRLLGTSDIASTQRQTFYVIVDGNNARFNRDADLPSGITFPVGRARLAQNTTPVTAGITFDPLTQMGWYEELGAGDNGIGWRVTSDSATFAGSVAWAATLPDGSVCNPSGSSRVYTRDFAGASTTVLGATAAGLSPVAFVTFSGTVTDLRYLSVGGKARLLSGTDLGSVTKVDISAIPGLSLRRLNWRELPIVE